MIFFLLIKAAKKPDFLKNLQVKLKEISEFLGAHHYSAGNNNVIKS